MALDHVFRPIALGVVEVPNRIVRTAHGTGLARGGQIGDELIAYHEARARGGVGLTILEVASVHPSSTPPRGRIRCWEDGIVAGYERLMKVLGPYGMRVFQQIYHGGHHMLPLDGRQPWGASTVPSVQLGLTPLEMTASQIAEIVEAFALAAGRAEAGGLDGVEIHGAHGYLIGQFLSPATNHRSDGYGGSRENRMRFLLEILAAVRGAVAPGFAVGVRLSAEDGIEDGQTVEDTIAIARALEAAGGLDFLDVSIGGFLRDDLMVGAMHHPRGYELPSSLPVARSVSVPAIVVGRIKTLEEAERVIASGEAQLVSMVRAHIAEPDLVRKTREGRAAEVRPCIGCNQMCLSSRGPQPQIGCTVNAAVGFELMLGDDRLGRTDAPRRVLVAGGGPAGMEAARTAALRGNAVVLCEAEDTLGGQLTLARRAPYRGDIGEVADYLAAELARLGVDVRVGTRVGAELVLREAFDAVVVATGSRPRRDGVQAARPGSPLPGIGLAHVRTARDVLDVNGNGNGNGIRSALVFDDLGHYEAVAAADHLVESGAEVHFATRFVTVAPQMESPRSAGPARARFARAGVAVHPNARLVSIHERRAVLGSLDDDSEAVLDVDAVVFVGPSLPDRALAGELREAGYPGAVLTIGEASGTPFLPAAVHSGNAAGREL